MKGKKKYVVLAVLLVMLAAAMAHYFFMQRLHDKILAFYESEAAGQLLEVAPAPDALPLKAGVQMPGAHGNINGYSHVPTWYGDLHIRNTTGRSCELELVAEVPNGPRVKLKAFEVTLRQDGTPPQSIVPVFRQGDKGRLLATVELPAAGTWQAEVRMHFDNQTLEFTRRLTVP